MATALAERKETSLALTVTSEQLALVKTTIAQGASDAELKLYLYDCQRQGVHPLDKLIHFTKRGGKYTPVTSIDLMRIRAAETNEYAGSDDAVFCGTPMQPDFAATVTVHRVVNIHLVPGKFTATARWSEYCPASGQDHMWRKMPHTMLAKCAEALALRKGFPRQLAGLYAKEEMDQAGTSAIMPDPPQTVVDVTTGAQVPASARPTPPDGFAYIDECLQDGAWFNVTWQGETYKTKLQRVGGLAEQAYQNGVPVKLHSKKAPWLDSVETWKPETAALAPAPSDSF